VQHRPLKYVPIYTGILSFYHLYYYTTNITPTTTTTTIIMSSTIFLVSRSIPSNHQRGCVLLPLFSHLYLTLNKHFPNFKLSIPCTYEFNVLFGPTRTLRKQYITFHIIPDMFRCRLYHPQGKLYRTLETTEEKTSFCLQLKLVFPPVVSNVLDSFPRGWCTLHRNMSGIM
jgi:hypothetical protein